MTRPALDKSSLIPASELAGIFHRSHRTISRWLADGVLPSVRVGPTKYVHRADVDALLAPAMAVRAQVQAAEAAGRPVLDAAQLALVRRVLADALGSLAVAEGNDTDHTAA
jgi:excisionase family DNA binding protein